MKSEIISNILVNMTLDMDFNDYIESMPDTLEELKNDIENIKKNNIVLYGILLNIAINNFDLYTSIV